MPTGSVPPDPPLPPPEPAWAPAPPLAPAPLEPEPPPVPIPAAAPAPMPAVAPEPLPATASSSRDEAVPSEAQPAETNAISAVQAGFGVLTRALLSALGIVTAAYEPRAGKGGSTPAGIAGQSCGIVATLPVEAPGQ